MYKYQFQYFINNLNSLSRQILTILSQMRISPHKISIFRKIPLVLFVIIYLTTSCAQTKKQASFEGIVTYKITVNTIQSKNTFYQKYQNQKFGQEMKFYILKDGSYKKEFTSSGEKGFEYSIYDAKTNINYTKWKNIDTLYTYNCSTNAIELSKENDLPNEFISGQNYKGYFISGIETISKQNVSMTYYYNSENPFVQPELYSNYHDFFYNKVMSKLQSPFFKLIMDLGKYSVTYEMTNIERKTLSSLIIPIPKNFPIKNL